MSIENKVFEKLFKLASQKVELALADDIETTRNASLRSADSSKAVFNKAQAGLIQYKDILGNVAQSANQVIQLIGQLKTKSKELGIEVPPKYLNLEKEANQRSKDFTAKYKSIDTIIKSM
jgi:hypothetical protein